MNLKPKVDEYEYDERDDRIAELEASIAGLREQNEALRSGQHFYVEGNNGGDYLDLRMVKDNVIRLEVGNCCVCSIRNEIPVEFITALLTDAIVYRGNDKTITGQIQALLGELWGENPKNKDFVAQLQVQVRQSK